MVTAALNIFRRIDIYRGHMIQDRSGSGRAKIGAAPVRLTYISRRGIHHHQQFYGGGRQVSASSSSLLLNIISYSPRRFNGRLSISLDTKKYMYPQ